MSDATRQVRRSLQAIYAGRCDPRMEAAQALTAIGEIEIQLSETSRLYQRALGLHRRHEAQLQSCEDVPNQLWLAIA